MRTEELIVRLAREAGPVRPLDRPSARLAQWIALAVPLALLGIFVVGPRPDVLTSLHQPTYVALAVVTLLTALASAASALVSSVPGAERSPVQRAIPVLAGTLWAAGLIVLLAAGGDSVARIMALPIHAACVVEIAAFGLLPGWALLTLLRRAAPLQPTWSAALAALAATSLGAVATQIVCPVDDPAHHLVGHFLPMVVLAIGATFAGRRSLDWLQSSLHDAATR